VEEDREFENALEFEIDRELEKLDELEMPIPVARAPAKAGAEMSTRVDARVDAIIRAFILDTSLWVWVEKPEGRSGVRPSVVYRQAGLGGS
jgi:hypothetical protein